MSKGVCIIKGERKSKKVKERGRNREEEEEKEVESEEVGEGREGERMKKEPRWFCSSWSE